MHYRHSFHAGNFADVFKHVVLVGLLAAMRRKDKPWCYLESHAGAGTYDLDSGGATRTGEWREGIGRIYDLQGAPSVLAEYLAQVRALNDGGELRRYPGSPWLAMQATRATDRLVLCERTEEVFGVLKQVTGRDRRVTLHRRDGYELPALLPPKENRGLALVDPPFEKPDEFAAMAEVLEASHKRFAGGVYALWYPLKNRHPAGKLVRRARALDEVLSLEFENGAPAEGQMRGCGMLVVNPPFGLRAELEPSLKVLMRELAQGPKAEFRIQDQT